ncbi:DMT family transporter [Georgenia wangjunii]|uniref:DMT family transporter n=1 Tax=Georgenia wangjunii TaxID=3117730 RepID=UPI002F26B06D
MSAERSPRAIGVMFALLALIWGSSFLLIKVALDGLSPAQVTLGRLVCGALALAGVMVVTRRRWPRGAAVWGHLTAISIVLCVAPFLLYSWAGQYIPSGLSSIYNATTPVTTLLVGLALLPDERLTRRRTVGLLAAGAGVVVVAAPWSALAGYRGENVLLAQAACLGATTCYGLAFVYNRRILRGYDYDPTTIAASQVGVAAVIMLVLAPAVAATPVALTVPVTASIVVLGAVGTGLAYVWNTTIIRAWGAAPASTVTYLTPVVGVALGVLVLGEELHWNEPVGAVLVILGVLVSQGRLVAPRPRATPPGPVGEHGAGQARPDGLAPDTRDR